MMTLKKGDCVQISDKHYITEIAGKTGKITEISKGAVLSGITYYVKIPAVKTKFSVRPSELEKISEEKYAANTL